MGLGSRNASRHETAASSRVAGVNPQDYWEFQPGAAVMTTDGISGTVTAVLDGPVAGNEAYQVTLDKGMGGGLYTASQLSPAGTTTASVEHTAADDYPELGSILLDRPDIAINTVLGSLRVTAADRDTLREIQRRDPDGNSATPPTEQDYANHKSWAISRYGPEAWAQYNGGGWDHQPGDEPDHMEYEGSKTAINDAEMSQYSNEVAHGHGSNQCQFCDMEGNADGAHGQPLRDTEWGPMHPDCAEEWEHGVGHDYDHDIDEYKADRENERQDDRDDPYYEHETANERVDPYGKGEDAVWRARTYSLEAPPFAHEADHGFHKDLQVGPTDDDPGGEQYSHGHDVYKGQQITFEPGLGCPHCKDGFMTEDARTRHIREQHPGEYSGPTEDLMMAKDRINEIRGQASKTAAVPNAHRDIDDLHPHCQAGNHSECEDYADTNCMCQCHDHYGVPLKYRTGWEDDQYYPESFTSTKPHPAHEASLDPYSLIREAASDSDFRFEFTASWSDVRNKAKRIRDEGGVRIVSAYKAGVVGEVRGDHHIYETGLQYVPGARKVATWQCGCKWAAYAWGRSPRYKRFEGRMCSHALALQFEASSRGMFGRDVKEDSHRLPGQHQRTPVVVEYDKDKAKNITRRTVPPGNMRTVWSKVVEPAPVITAVAHMATSGDDVEEIGLFLTASRIESDALVAFAKTAAVNDAWGEPAAPQNTWPTLPGATKPKDPQENPASAGFAAGPDPAAWHDIAPMTMGDRVASVADSDVCSNCGKAVRRSNDPNVPWIHHETGNSYCDVDVPEDAVMFAGTPERNEAAPVLHEASQNDEDTALWDGGGDNLEGEGAVATIHDEPEPALPSTDGSTDGLLGDQSDQMHAVYDDALSPESESIQTVGSAVQDDPSVAAIVAEFQRTAGAQVIMKDSGRGSGAGPSDGDIAAAARAHLEGKTAMKSFSPEEQRALISEPGRAGNTDMLDIADTHYAALDAIRGEDDDEDWMG